MRATAQKAAQPARLALFEIEVTTHRLDKRHQAGILGAVKACLIHNTLLGGPSVEIMVDAGALALV